MTRKTFQLIWGAITSHKFAFQCCAKDIPDRLVRMLVVGHLMEPRATHSDPKCRRQISSFAKTPTVRVAHILPCCFKVQPHCWTERPTSNSVKTASHVKSKPGDAIIQGDQHTTMTDWWLPGGLSQCLVSCPLVTNCIAWAILTWSQVSWWAQVVVWWSS